MDGELVPWDEAQIHVLSHALHYGTGVFEGIRAYQTDSGPGLFRLTDHMERLHSSAEAYSIPLSYSVDELCKAAREVVTRNGLHDGYLRPLVFLGLGSIGLNPEGAATQSIIAAWKWGAYHGDEGVRKGITAMISSWRRIESTALVASAKGSGGYLNNVMAKAEALRSGAEEALVLNAEDKVVEASGMNVFIVKDGVVITPPPADGILPGITRASVMTLLSDAGHPVREQSITREDTYAADEVFLTGTAAEVAPIRQVDDRPISSGRPGPVTQLAQRLYGQAVRGELDSYRGWVELV